MKIKFYNTACKMTVVICLLCLTGFLFSAGCATLSTKDAALDKAFKIDEVDQPPQIIKAFSPGYPFSAAQERIEGRVVVRMVIDSDGKIKEPEVFKSEPEGVFDAAALDALTQYRFQPALKDGKPVSCIVHLPVKFDVSTKQPDVGEDSGQ